jgi:hypothetical protein
MTVMHQTLGLQATNNDTWSQVKIGSEGDDVAFGQLREIGDGRQIGWGYQEIGGPLIRPFFQSSLVLAGFEKD